jgi:hypothetical protein
MTKLLLEFGGNLSFTTWWSTDDAGGITMGQGEQTGNAIQLIGEVRTQKEKINGSMKVEDVDKLLKSISTNLFSFWKNSVSIKMKSIIIYYN